MLRSSLAISVQVVLRSPLLTFTSLRCPLFRDAQYLSKDGNSISGVPLALPTVKVLLEGFCCPPLLWEVWCMQWPSLVMGNTLLRVWQTVQFPGDCWLLGKS